jgi:hypothetical protein
VACSDGSGGAIIAWADDRSGTWALYAQRVNSVGVTQWAANGIQVSGNLAFATSNTASEYSITTDTQGGAYILWATSPEEVRIQRYNASGAALFAAGGVVLENTGHQQYFLSLVPDGSGGAIGCWQEYHGASPFDVYGQRVNSAGVAQWAAGGLGVCTNASDQQLPVVAADGQGGAYFAWGDDRSGTSDAYAQHISAGGTAVWTVDGIPIAGTADFEFAQGIAGDGAGGVIVEWSTFNSLYVQRLNYSGVVQWGVGGIPVVSGSQFAGGASVIPDGAGGAIVNWYDRRNGNIDVFAQRITAAGSFEWNSAGVGVCTQPSNQSLPAYSSIIPTIASDGAGGAIFVWLDARSDAGDVFAQRVEHFGRLGSPEPTITKVSDVIGDQGRAVSLQWTASYLDVEPTYEIANYSIWRQTPAAMATAALRSGARLVASSEPMPRVAAGTRLYRAWPAASGTAYWEYLLTVPARGFPGYSHVPATMTDSVTGSNPLTTFMVMAEDSGGIPFWASAPDSGYSVDNLPPAAPTPFTGVYAGGATHLHWGENTEPDLNGYRLYRGSSSGFVPGPGNLISAQPDTGYSDLGPAGRYYKLSAIDTHGNESAFSLLGPGGTLDTGNPNLPRTLALAQPRPNPARGQAMLSFALPSPGMIQLEIYDLDGRLVRTLRSGLFEAGEYPVPFDLRDDAGRALASGLYFARFHAEGRVLMRRVTIVQ